MKNYEKLFQQERVSPRRTWARSKVRLSQPAPPQPQRASPAEGRMEAVVRKRPPERELKIAQVAARTPTAWQHPHQLQPSPVASRSSPRCGERARRRPIARLARKLAASRNSRKQVKTDRNRALPVSIPLPQDSTINFQDRTAKCCRCDPKLNRCHLSVIKTQHTPMWTPPRQKADPRRCSPHRGAGQGKSSSKGALLGKKRTKP